MTTSNYTKVFKQLKAKPAKLTRFIKHNAPKKRSAGVYHKKCRRCGRTGAHIQRWGLKLCRQCFRETAQKIGFRKYN